MDRIAQLRALLQYDEPPAAVLEGLSAFGWDSEAELVTLTRHHILNVVQRFLRGELTAENLEEWANAIEGRDDLALEREFEGPLKEVIFEMANPIITRSPTNATKDWLKLLKL